LMAIRWLDYAELQPLRSGLWLPLFDLAKARPSAFYVLGDAVFASVALVGAYAIAGDGALTREVLRSLVYLLPILVATQTISLLMGGLYSRPFRNAGLGDVLVILRAIGLAVALGWLVAGSVWRPSLSVTVLDAYLLATLIIGSRLSLVVLDYIFASARSPQRRVVIYGADSAGLALLDDIRSAAAPNMTAIAFIDDDPEKWGKTLGGTPVKAPAALDGLLRERQVDEMVVSTPNIGAERFEIMAKRCAVWGLPVRRFSREAQALTHPPAGRGLAV